MCPRIYWQKHQKTAGSEGYNYLKNTSKIFYLKFRQILKLVGY